MFGSRICRSGFYSGFMDREQTMAVEGLFIWMVFLSHVLLEVRNSGFQPTGALDVAGYWLRSELGQLVVVPFLFYSGYGVMESIKNKGRDYLDRFPRRRLLNTLLNFDVAVLSFILLNLVMGVHMSLTQVGGALVGWDSVGNSNWYIFIILFCYLLTWVSGKVFPDGTWRTVAMTSILVLVVEAVLSFMKHGQPWWYNTLLSYPAGMCFSLYKNKITRLFERYYLPFLLFFVTVFLFLHLQSWIPALRGLTYNVKGIAFALIIVMVTMRIKVGNRFLYWAGASVFPIYIYERLPMRAFRHWAGDAWVCANPYLIILLCALITGCIALLYRHWRIQLQ